MSQAKCILVVDDNANDVSLTLMALARQKGAHTTVVANDGAEALDYLYRRGAYQDRPGGQPHVVLLDLKMPCVDGLEVLRQMKNDTEMRGIPVVMLTSSREEKDLVKSYQLGANAYVVKPVDFQEFLEAIKEVGLFWTAINEVPSTRLANPQVPASNAA